MLRQNYFQRIDIEPLTVGAHRLSYVVSATNNGDTTMANIWIDADFATVGDVGFLGMYDPLVGKKYYVLSDTPFYTNLSREPKLTGWCGSTNNVSLTARGVWRVARATKNGRAQIVRLTEKETREWLEEAGWESLAA